MAPLAVGSVHTEMVFALGLIALAAWLVQGVVLSDHKVNRTNSSLPSLAFWLLASISLIQLVPLPPSVIELASPTRWAHFQEGWTVLFPDRAPSDAWMPLSLDPEQTADRSLRWLVLAMIALLAANHAHLRHAWRDTLRMVTISGVVVLAVGAIQLVAGAEKVLFLYAPEASIKAYTTFISPNHAAVFFGLASICSFALALRSFEHNMAEAAGATLIGVILMVAMAEQDSVGATIGFGLSISALIGLFLQSRQARRIFARRRAKLLSLGVLTLPFAIPVVILLALRFGPSWVSERFLASDLGQWLEREGGTRVELMSAALEGSGDYPLIGAGAGSIGRVLSPYLDWSILPMGVVPTIENEPVQWLLEFGWVVGPIAIILLATYLWFAFRAHTQGNRLRSGVALAAGLFLAFNAQFHFPFFALGIAVPAVFVLETALSRTASSKTHPFGDGYASTDHRFVRRGVALTISGAMALSLLAGTMYEVHFAAAVDADRPEGKLERLNRLTPTEGELYARASRVADGNAQVRRLAAHAVELEPTAQMKLFLAQTLWSTGERDDAIAAYQEVFGEAYPRVHRAWISKYLVPVVREPEAIATALRDGNKEQWQAAARACRAQLGTTEETRFAIALVEQRPQDYAPYRLLIESYLHTKQYDLAELWSRLLIARSLEGPNGEAPAGKALLVTSLWQQGKRKAAHALVLEDLERITMNEALAMLVMRLRTEDPRQAAPAEVEAVSRFRSSYCSEPNGRQRQMWCWVAEGWLAEREERLRDAQFAFERIQRKLDAPEFVGTFFVRHEMCLELNELISRLKSREQRLGPLERLTGACAETGKDD
jgi:hypothetical protein